MLLIDMCPDASTKMANALWLTIWDANTSLLKIKSAVHFDLQIL